MCDIVGAEDIPEYLRENIEHHDEESSVHCGSFKKKIDNYIALSKYQLSA